MIHGAVAWLGIFCTGSIILSSEEEVDEFVGGTTVRVAAFLPPEFDTKALDAVAERFATEEGGAVSFGVVAGTEAGALLRRAAQSTANDCALVHVGPSPKLQMRVPLPAKGLGCEALPREDDEDAEATFKLTVTGKFVQVQRKDVFGSWNCDLSIRCCKKRDIPGEVAAAAVPAVMMFFPFDEKVAVFNGNLQDEKTLTNFLLQRLLPLVSQYDDQTEILLYDIARTHQIPLLVRVDEEGRGDSDPDSLFASFAARVRGKAIAVRAFSVTCEKIQRLFDMVTGSCKGRERDRKLMEDLGLFLEEGRETFPVIRLLDVLPDDSALAFRRYQAPGASDLQPLLSWFDDYSSGKVRPMWRSLPPPKEAYEPGKIRTLVAETFEKEVFSSGLDTFVYFSSPVCPHCRVFDKVYPQIATAMTNDDGLMLATMDGKRQDTPGVSISSYPYFLLYRSGVPRPVRYQGFRQPDEVVEWIRTHRTAPRVKLGSMGSQVAGDASLEL